MVPVRHQYGFAQPDARMPGRVVHFSRRTGELERGGILDECRYRPISDDLLNRYAGGGAADLRNTLIGPTRDGMHYLHRPLLTTVEQDAVIALVEAELRSLGGGSITAGEAIIDARRAEHSHHLLRRPIHP